MGGGYDMNDGSVQWQKVEQRLGKGRMGARKRKMMEGEGERERRDEGRGSWRGSEREKGKWRERKIILYSTMLVGASEREYGGRIRMEWMPGIDRSG